MKKKLQNEPDIVGLITRIQEQIALLDRKMDALMNRCSSQARPASQPLVNHAAVQGGGRQNEPQKARLMHPATCADCKQGCEVPFKPSADRPVYCKECFARRKVASAVKAVPDHQLKESLPVPAVVSAAINIPQPPARKKKKPVAKKKPVVKKKK